MPTPTKGPRLGGGPAHERLLLANLATQLFTYRSITTTETKAKRVRPLAERMITFAKRGDLASRRRVLTVIRDKGVVHQLFTEIAPVMAERQGGYTRITKIGNRKGDNAPMAVIELVLEPLTAKQATVREAEAATRVAAKKTAKKSSAKETAVAAEARAEDKATEAEEAKLDSDADAAVEAAGEAEGAAAVAEDALPGSDVAQDAEAAADLAADAANKAIEAPLAEGSAAPLADGSAPEGFTVKGNRDSMKYHEPDGRWFDSTIAEVWFDSAASAEAAGFTKAGAK